MLDRGQRPARGRRFARFWRSPRRTARRLCCRARNT